MEQIFIQDLKVYGYFGVFPEEKKNGQEFLVQARADLSFSKAAKNDDLDQTVNYGNLCLLIRDFFESERFDLLESAAAALADKILQTYPLIEKLFLEIGKPKAPIPMEFSNVGVRISRKWHRCALSIGSNMGNKKEHLDFAIDYIKNAPFIRNVKVSDYLVTKPYGYLEQEDFLNGALLIETYLSPEKLLDFLHEIENTKDRQRQIHWGPRTLDLDILLYDDLVMNTENLIIPHADMCNRMFVLEPLCQIAPHLVHPWKHKSIMELYEEIK